MLSQKYCHSTWRLFTKVQNTKTQILLRKMKRTKRKSQLKVQLPMMSQKSAWSNLIQSPWRMNKVVFSHSSSFKQSKKWKMIKKKKLSHLEKRMRKFQQTFLRQKMWDSIWIKSSNLLLSQRIRWLRVTMQIWLRLQQIKNQQPQQRLNPKLQLHLQHTIQSHAQRWFMKFRAKMELWKSRD